MQYLNLTILNKCINLDNPRYFNTLNEEQEKSIKCDDLESFKENFLNDRNYNKYVCVYVVKKILQMKSYKILEYLNSTNLNNTNKKNILQTYLEINEDKGLTINESYAISVCTELMCSKDYRGLVKLLNLGVIQLDEFYMNNFVWYEHLNSNKYYTKQKAECNRFRRYNNLMAMSINRLIEISQLKLNLDTEKTSLIRNTKNCIEELESIYELLENILKISKDKLDENEIIERHIYYSPKRTDNKVNEYNLGYKFKKLNQCIQKFVKEYDVLELTAENDEERFYNINIIEKVQTMKNIFSNSIYLLSTNIKDK